ncbi:putative ArCR [uncultured archaeon]|nr:putative ArCR [uncultured archaeon]
MNESSEHKKEMLSRHSPLRVFAMNLEEMSDILKTALGIEDNIVGVALFKHEEDIPKKLESLERPFMYCQMIQTARLHGDSFLAHADYHECKLGASSLGLVNCPEEISSSGSIYFDKLMKCNSEATGASIYENMLHHQEGSIVATYVAPLDKMVVDPEVVIFVGTPIQARRITQAMIYKSGGKSTFSTAGLQSFCMDATTSPYLKGELNVSLGCDGSSWYSGLDDDSVVVGIPFGLMEDICTVLRDHYEDWATFMRGWQNAVKVEASEIGGTSPEFRVI